VTKRRDGLPMCITRGCRRARLDGEKLCVVHEADRVWAERVKDRDGYCRAPAWLRPDRCLGRLEADHLISRSYGATRWELANGVTLCLAHHKYVTEHPLEHIDLALDVLGEELYWSLHRLARTYVAENADEALDRLRGAAA
jgi:hypothetical protein